jgi:macrolide-specific efflux system membrane fusion protein
MKTTKGKLEIKCPHPHSFSLRERDVKQGNGKSRTWVRAISVTLYIFTFAFLLSSCSQKAETPLKTATVKRGNILAQLPTTGVVIPRNNLNIKPPVAGRIEEVLVEEGQLVKKGQVLAWMSSSERAALLDAALAKGAAEVKYWQEVYKPAPIVAPLNGFITKRNMQPGQFFSQNEDVMVMADVLIVEAQVDETDIGRIKLNQSSTIILDAYPDQKIAGHVEKIAYQSDTINNVTIYRVDVLPQAVPSFFRSGMSATVNFMMDERKKVLTLPINAIKKAGGRSFAFVQEKDKVKAVPIKTGLENTENVELISGLAEGQQVVIPTAKIAQEAMQRNQFRGGPFNFLRRR